MIPDRAQAIAPIGVVNAGIADNFAIDVVIREIQSLIEIQRQRQLGKQIPAIAKVLPANVLSWIHTIYAAQNVLEPNQAGKANAYPRRVRSAGRVASNERGFARVS